VNNASDNWPYHFVITYTEDEIRASCNAATARYVIQGTTLTGTAFAFPIVIGLVVLGAFKLG